MWMRRPGWVVHKRAFVTLGHNSLSLACSGVGHKGIGQSEPVGGRAMPETYRYVRTSRPRVSEPPGNAGVNGAEILGHWGGEIVYH